MGLEMRHWNSNLLKCRNMPQSLSKQTKTSLIKRHWSGGGSFSVYSLSRLDFSNHLAPNETPLSLCIVIGSVSRWWLVSNLPIDPGLDQASLGHTVQHSPSLHLAMYIVKVMAYKGWVLTCGGWNMQTSWDSWCEQKRWGPLQSLCWQRVQ